jgi:hypothetical protein
MGHCSALCAGIGGGCWDRLTVCQVIVGTAMLLYVSVARALHHWMIVEAGAVDEMYET